MLLKFMDRWTDAYAILEMNVSRPVNVAYLRAHDISEHSEQNELYLRARPLSKHTDD